MNRRSTDDLKHPLLDNATTFEIKEDISSGKNLTLYGSTRPTDNTREYDTHNNSESQEGDERESVVDIHPQFSLKTLRRDQSFVLISICWCQLTGFLCLSIMAPFFPEVVCKHVFWLGFC